MFLLDDSNVVTRQLNLDFFVRTAFCVYGFALWFNYSAGVFKRLSSWYSTVSALNHSLVNTVNTCQHCNIHAFGPGLNKL
jgi:hypothetical protein